MSFLSRLDRFDKGLAIVIFAMVVVTYLPALDCGFIWDDDDYVQFNPTVAALDGIWKIWVPGENHQYYPLVHTTFWLEYRLWGTSPAGFHLVNVLIHALSSVLLYSLLARLAVPGAWLGAALFALHPVGVESVAWITERKNVLSGLFYLLSARLYLDWAGGGETRGTPRLWWLALLAFVAALLSKTVTASLPAALLVVTWWKTGRVRVRDVSPLLPFFVIGLGMGLLTIWVERTYVGATGEGFDLSLTERVLVAGRAPWFYLGKLLLPLDLAFIYRRVAPDTGSWVQWLYPLAVVATLLGALLLRSRLGRAPLAVLLLFGGTLVPALGFVDVYPFLFSFTADHFQYHAMIAPLALLGALATSGARSLPEARRPLALGAGAALLGTLGLFSWRQQAIYVDLETLWTDTVAKTPGAWIAHTNLGTALAARGAREEAISSFEQALELRPEMVEARANMGRLLLESGAPTRAASELRRALGDLPPDDQIREGTGNAIMRKMLRFNLGAALRLNNRPAEALPFLQAAADDPPATSQEHFNLGLVHRSLNRARPEVFHLEEARRLSPEDPEVARQLAWSLATRPRVGDAGRAVTLAEEALAVFSGDPLAHHTLAIAFAARSSFDQAVTTARQALELAERTGRPRLAEDIRRSLELYGSGQPYVSATR